MFPRARNCWFLLLALGIAMLSHISCSRVEGACGDYLLTGGMSRVEMSHFTQLGMELHRDNSVPQSGLPMRTCVGGSCQRELPPLVPIQPLGHHQLSKKFAAAAGEIDNTVIAFFSTQSLRRDQYPRPIEDGVFHPPRLDTFSVFVS
jgi:hypothetical protein